MRRLCHILSFTCALLCGCAPAAEVDEMPANPTPGSGEAHAVTDWPEGGLDFVTVLLSSYTDSVTLIEDFESEGVWQTMM